MMNFAMLMPNKFLEFIMSVKSAISDYIDLKMKRVLTIFFKNLIYL
jgi:hypothetical protein